MIYNGGCRGIAHVSLHSLSMFPPKPPGGSPPAAGRTYAARLKTSPRIRAGGSHPPCGRNKLAAVVCCMPDKAQYPDADLDSGATAEDGIGSRRHEAECACCRLGDAGVPTGLLWYMPGAAAEAEAATMDNAVDVWRLNTASRLQTLVLRGKRKPPHEGAASFGFTK